MKIKLASVAVSFGLLLCAPNISAISNLAAGDDLLTAGSVVAVFGLPLIPAGITFGVGAAVNSNKTKGDFGYSYLGS